MQEWLLNEKINFDDIGFINGCGIKYRLIDPSLLGPDDSGWCDATTGYRVPTPTMRVIFEIRSEEDIGLLKLKFADAIVPMSIAEELKIIG